MLAGRFIVYCVGMIVIAAHPQTYRIWLDSMVGIQVIDLGAGLFHVATGTVALSNAIIPMGNAALFILLMIWVRPRSVGAGSTAFA